MTSTLIPNKSLTVVTSDFKVITVCSDHPNWVQIINALRKNDEAAVIALSSVKAAFESFGSVDKTVKGNITVEGNSVSYKGRKLFGLDVDRIVEYCSQNIPADSMIKFLEKKLQNPSHRSIEQLYSFLEHGNMPITPEGNFLAYKGIQDSWYSVTAGLLTLINGKADGSNNTGHIYNGIGEVIECPRNEVCDDFEVACSPGLHAGSLEYAKGWGTRTIIVEIDPAHVVSVPKDCSCQKLRCHKYKVVGEFVGALPETFTAQYSETPVETAVTNGIDDIEDDDWEYDEGFEAGNDDAACSLLPAYVQGNDNYSKGYMDGYAEYKKSIVPPVVTSVDPTEDKYSDGYGVGYGDGKSHKARKHYETDTIQNDYTKGYNQGYRDGRKGK